MNTPIVPDGFLEASNLLEASIDADRPAIIDALYRFGAGQDLQNPELLASAFAESAVLDFTQPARRFGISISPFSGAHAIVQQIGNALNGVQTTHTFTNVRVFKKNDATLLQALCEAQHISLASSAHFLLKNWYWCRLVHDQPLWKFENMTITNVWHTGQSNVLFRGSDS